MEKIYKCFISSTFEDLKEERLAVIEAILDAHQLPVAMENFQASNASQWAYIKRMLENTDYFIVIVAHRYGTIDDNDGISYTEKETKYADGMGIPILPFIISKDASWEHKKYDTDSINIERLDGFKKFLETGRHVKYWVDKSDLARRVESSVREAIITIPRPGYIRGTAPAEPASSSESARKPEFSIEFEGKPEIKISLSDIRPVEQMEIMDHVQELSHGQPVKLKVTDRDVDKWNRAVPNYNREIDEYNAEATEYNKRKLALPYGFSVFNTGTKKATDIVVALEFPDWIELFNGMEAFEKPDRPRIPVNPVRRAMDRMKDVLQPVQVVHGNMVTPVSETPVSLRELAEIAERAKWLSITSSHTALCSIPSLKHGFGMTCDILHILPAVWANKSGSVKVEFHCEELARPQVIEIPISMVG